MKKIIRFTVLCLLAGQTFANADEPPAKHVIDTHIHLYDSERELPLSWPPTTDKLLFHPHLPPKWKKVAKAAGVTHTVVVEASDLVEDNQWVLDITKDDAFFPGLVARLEPADEKFAAQVKRFSKNPRFVGIRPRLGEVDLDDPLVVKHLKLLESQGLTLDHLMNGGMTSAKIAKIAERYPKLKIIVDHAVGINPDGKPLDEEEQQALATLKDHPNVNCKVSGFFEHCVTKPAPTTVEYHKPLLDGIWETFGEDRLIFASNWPVIRKGGSLADHVKMVDEYFSTKGDEVVEKVFWKNAVRVYGLELE